MNRGVKVLHTMRRLIGCERLETDELRQARLRRRVYIPRQSHGAAAHAPHQTKHGAKVGHVARPRRGYGTHERDVITLFFASNLLSPCATRHALCVSFHSRTHIRVRARALVSVRRDAAQTDDRMEYWTIEWRNRRRGRRRGIDIPENDV